MKATEQCLAVVRSVMLYKLVLTFEAMGEILPCGVIYYAGEGGS